MNNIIKLLQAFGNPQQLINNVMRTNNPMIQNAVELAQKGDSQGLEQLVRNVAQAKGVNVDEMFQQVKSQMKF